MIGAGFIADMNKKLQQNRALLQNNGFSTERTNFIKTLKKQNISLNQ